MPKLENILTQDSIYNKSFYGYYGILCMFKIFISGLPVLNFSNDAKD